MLVVYTENGWTLNPHRLAPPTIADFGDALHARAGGCMAIKNNL